MIVSMVWNVLHDDGGGVTQSSLKYFRRHVRKIGQCFEVNIDQDRLFSMEIQGNNGVLLLSGCNCGYGGEGPHGTLEVLRTLGVKGADNEVFHKRQVRIDLRRGWGAACDERKPLFKESQSKEPLLPASRFVNHTSG